ncbi:MAG: insulinase family protein [Candidatus Aminicenantes bacterium]|nr:insulinase family protein [Candidatus Aminicenantes bacterium]
MRALRQAFLIFAVLMAPAIATATASPSSYFVLDNGLRVLLQEKRGLPLTGMALAIDLGTKDETDETSGYVHLLEHMLLFGAAGDADSESRQAEFRRHGAACNAHTDHDLTTFEISCPADESAWALEQMRRTVFDAHMDPRQLESEKCIILQEILQLRDDPDTLGQLMVMESLFAGHPYGRPVYGDGANLKAASVDSLQAFYRPRLLPGRCALAVVGDFTLADMEGEVRRRWGAMPEGGTPPADMPDPGRLEKSREQQLELDVQESHLFIGWRAPAFNDAMRLPFRLLTHILGRGWNPLFLQVLRGRRRLVERVSMGYYPLRGDGMAMLHLILDQREIRAAKSEVAAFLSRITSFHFSKRDVLPQQRTGVLDYLESAQNQVEYENGSFHESALNLSVAAARFLLLQRGAIAGSYLENVRRVTSADLRRAAGRFLSGKKWVVVAITPLAGRGK